MEQLPSLSHDEIRVWGTVEGTREADFVRLGILRSHSRRVHARLSKSMVDGSPRETRARLQAYERRLEALAGLRPIPSDAVSGAAASGDANGSGSVRKPSPRALPAELDRHLPRDGFARYDRAWEREILAECLSIGGSLWSIEATLPASDASAWQERLEAKLFPEAWILFVETLGFDAPDWRGRWFLASKPELAGKDLGILTGMQPRLLFRGAVS